MITSLSSIEVPTSQEPWFLHLTVFTGSEMNKLPIITAETEWRTEPSTLRVLHMHGVVPEEVAPPLRLWANPARGTELASVYINTDVIVPSELIDAEPPGDRRPWSLHLTGESGLGTASNPGGALLWHLLRRVPGAWAATLAAAAQKKAQPKKAQPENSPEHQAAALSYVLLRELIGSTQAATWSGQ